MKDLKDAKILELNYRLRELNDAYLHNLHEIEMGNELLTKYQTNMLEYKTENQKLRMQNSELSIKLKQKDDDLIFIKATNKQQLNKHEQQLENLKLICDEKLKQMENENLELRKHITSLQHDKSDLQQELLDCKELLSKSNDEFVNEKNKILLEFSMQNDMKINSFYEEKLKFAAETQKLKDTIELLKKKNFEFQQKIIEMGEEIEEHREKTFIDDEKLVKIKDILKEKNLEIKNIIEEKNNADKENMIKIQELEEELLKLKQNDDQKFAMHNSQLQNLQSELDKLEKELEIAKDEIEERKKLNFLNDEKIVELEDTILQLNDTLSSTNQELHRCYNQIAQNQGVFDPNILADMLDELETQAGVKDSKKYKSQILKQKNH
eukprot:TRINITY_DN3227_c3_g1_i6.p3 TRINITY_DN3227_c3_g1~~TRINITY_DN3227_c3_g1_i6.p3  ORF type:complete len:380 (+),score=150.17 TRINITY_DN3227_c3_g1_i6:52-1191(+)